MRRWLAPLTAVLLVGTLGSASYAEYRGTEAKDVADALCPRPGQTTPDCYTLPVPGAQAWVVAAIAEPKEGAEALYDSLVPRPYLLPEKRQVALLSSRLNLGTGDPRNGPETAPDKGYQEGSIALRVGFPARDGFPYSEGWFVLAQPISDFGQYEAGRDVGIPKYMADMSVVKDGDTWTQSALNMGSNASQTNGPGSTTVTENDMDLSITWTPEAVEADEQEVKDVERWTIFGDPLFGHKRPYDDPNVNLDVPFMTKFTPAAYAPVGKAGAVTPLTYGPYLKTGLTDVTLTGNIPTTSTPWSDLVGPEQLTDIPGTFGFINGMLYITMDDLSNDVKKLHPRPTHHHGTARGDARRAVGVSGEPVAAHHLRRRQPGNDREVREVVHREHLEHPVGDRSGDQRLDAHVGALPVAGVHAAAPAAATGGDGPAARPGRLDVPQQPLLDDGLGHDRQAHDGDGAHRDSSQPSARASARYSGMPTTRLKGNVMPRLVVR